MVNLSGNTIGRIFALSVRESCPGGVVQYFYGGNENAEKSETLMETTACVCAGGGDACRCCTDSGYRRHGD